MSPRRQPKISELRDVLPLLLRKEGRHNQPAMDTNLRPRVVHVVTSDLAVCLVRGQLRFLQQQGFDVTLVCSPGKSLNAIAREENVQVIELPMTRAIAPVKDFVSLWRLWRVMRRLNPTITNVSTPKAGLLGGCAAWLARVPCRFYTLRGLRLETVDEPTRRLLVFAERLACYFAHRVICVSQSLREKAIETGLTTRERMVVFGSGSSNGVDASRYAPTPESLRQAAKLRCKLGIPTSARVVGFAGRVTNDKGIPELVEAFLRLGQEFPDLRLLLPGRFEDEDPLAPDVRKCIEEHPRVILAGVVDDMALYYALMDVFVLPSRREGFPNVVLEAMAAGKPVVGARATGTVDAIVDGETGLLFPVGDVTALTEALAMLMKDKVLANRLARAGQEQVRRHFRRELIWQALYREYLGLLQMDSVAVSQPGDGLGGQVT